MVGWACSGGLPRHTNTTANLTHLYAHYTDAVLSLPLLAYKPIVILKYCAAKFKAVLSQSSPSVKGSQS